MADQPSNQGAEPSGTSAASFERLVGQLEAVLRDLGVEIPGNKNRDDILRAAIEHLKSLPKKKAEDGESTDSDAVANAVRAKLGIDPGASTSELLLAVSLWDPDSKHEATTLRREADDRAARDRVAKYVNANVINPNDRAQYEAALDLAGRDPEAFEKLVARMAPHVAPGQTVEPKGNASGRGHVITLACRAYNEGGKTLQDLTDRESFVNMKLVEASFNKLSDEEVKTLG